LQTLMINLSFGMAGDMFISAFISSGVPAAKIQEVMTTAAAFLGGADIRIHTITRAGYTGTLLEIDLLAPPRSTEAELIREQLLKTLDTQQITGHYRAFAIRALDNLIHAEEHAHAKMEHNTHSHHHHHHCHLHEAQDILIDITGAAWAMQYSQVDMDHITCLSPVITGKGKVHFSHGTLPLPAPATAAIIEEYHLPAESGSLETELLTPTGAALLAACKPKYQAREEFAMAPNADSWSVGFGTKDLTAQGAIPNALYIRLTK